MTDEVRHLPDTFAALGNRTRLQIVEQLLREGEVAAGDVRAVPAISAPAMSHHLKVLREAGILQQRVDRQRRLYSVRPEAVQAIGEWTLTYREFWEQGLGRLAAALKQARDH